MYEVVVRGKNGHEGQADSSNAEEVAVAEFDVLGVLADMLVDADARVLREAPLLLCDEDTVRVWPEATMLAVEIVVRHAVAREDIDGEIVCPKHNSGSCVSMRVRRKIENMPPQKRCGAQERVFGVFRHWNFSDTHTAP